jgi:hypothetical protein
MAYGEPQLQDWDVQYKVQVVHPDGGYIQITAADQNGDPAYQAKLDTAVQAALDLLVSSGFTLDQGLKSCAAAQTITPTPVE